MTPSVSATYDEHLDRYHRLLARARLIRGRLEEKAFARDDITSGDLDLFHDLEMELADAIGKRDEVQPIRTPPAISWRDDQRKNREAAFSRMILGRLDPFFHIYPEVTGKSCDGTPMRIDAIVRPKDTKEWKNPSVALGIEFKVPHHSDGSTSVGDFAKWIMQSVDYAHTVWPKFGRIYVFTCPGVTKLFGDRGIDPKSGSGLLARIGARGGVGELKEESPGNLVFALSADHPVWSEKRGVLTCGRTWNLERKVGSR